MNKTHESTYAYHMVFPVQGGQLEYAAPVEGVLVLRNGNLEQGSQTGKMQ